MNRKADPRDGPAEPEPSSDLVDLGETRIPTRLVVAPTSLGALGGRRALDPRLAVVVAIAIVAVAALGTGPLAPRARPTPSTVPTTSPEFGVTSPDPTDPCPAVAPLPPSVFVGPVSGFTSRADAAGTAVNFQDVEVIAPVEHKVEIRAGVQMRLSVSDNRCVDLVGIDVFDTSRPHGNGLTIRVPAPFEAAARSATWEAPPAGDWILRIALRLRERAGVSATGSWFVYFFRLNSGFVSWASPVPKGVDGSAGDPIVTPAAACGTAPTDVAGPPAVDLVLGSETVPGVLGSYGWRGTTVENVEVVDLASSAPVELTGPYSLEVAGGVCAANWTIVAGLLGDDPPFAELWWLDQSPENPHRDVGIAAQNTFALRSEILGEYIIQAWLEFPNGDFEVRYWRVHVPVPAVAEAHMFVDPVGSPVAMAAGCGVRVERRDGNGYELCREEWTEPPNSPTITATTGGMLRVDVRDLTIVGWSVEYSDPEHPGEASCTLTSGYGGTGLPSVEIPAPEPGEWIVRISLGYRDADGTTLTVPYFVRLEVTAGDASPRPSLFPCAPGFVD